MAIRPRRNASDRDLRNLKLYLITLKWNKLKVRRAFAVIYAVTREVSFQWYTHLIVKEYLVYSYRVDYVNFCFAYVISLLHNSRQNKKATTKSACTHPILLWSAAAICRKPCCLQVENYTPNMAHALITSTHICLQNHHSATTAFIRSLHPLPFCCSQELYNRAVLGAHTSYTPLSSQVRSKSHDLTRSIQLYSRSNRFIMFTFHANVPKHHVTAAEYE